MKTIIAGFGNDILGDDGIGIRLAADIGAELKLPVATCSIFGFEIIERLTGYDRAYIIDAMTTAAGAVGDVSRLDTDNVADLLHLSSPHSTNFAAGLHLGRLLGESLPREIYIYGIEAKQVNEFTEELSAAMRDRYHDIRREILDDMGGR